MLRLLFWETHEKILKKLRLRNAKTCFLENEILESVEREANHISTRGPDFLSTALHNGNKQQNNTLL